MGTGVTVLIGMEILFAIARDENKFCSVPKVVLITLMIKIRNINHTQAPKARNNRRLPMESDGCHALTALGVFCYSDTRACGPGYESIGPLVRED